MNAFLPAGGIQQHQMSEHLSNQLRRDSFGSQDLKQQPPLTNFANQFYGAGLSPGGGIGLLAAGPAAMTPPPPTLSLSNSIPLNGDEANIRLYIIVQCC